MKHETQAHYDHVVSEMFRAGGHNIVSEPIDYFTNWFQISIKRAAKFKINAFLNNQLCAAYTRYLNMVGVTDSGIWCDCTAHLDRQLYQDYLPPTCPLEASKEYLTVDIEMQARFMSEVCNLPLPDCQGYILYMISLMREAGLGHSAPR